jgi:hypothetical protein
MKFTQFFSSIALKRLIGCEEKVPMSFADVEWQFAITNWTAKRYSITKNFPWDVKGEKDEENNRWRKKIKAKNRML